MRRFSYRAMDAEGNPFTGTMEATSSRQVTSHLQEQGLTVNSVVEVNKPKGLLRISNKLSPSELYLFAEQLYAITRTSLPLPAALRSLAADLKGSRLKPVLEGIERDVAQGFSLDEAIERQHEAFPPLFSGIIRAGEASGNLPGVLQIYLQHTKRMMMLRSTLTTALAYPIMILILCVIIVGYLLIKVMPVYEDIFEGFGARLPIVTRFWLSAGDMLSNQWPLLCLYCGGIVMLMFLLRWGMMSFDAGRTRLDWLRLHFPILGHLYYLLAVSRFARSLAVMLASQAPLLPSLELAAAASESPMLQRAVKEANLYVAEGERIADALAGTGFFTFHFCWLLGMGEDRGEAELTLDNIAETLENEILFRDRLLGMLWAPALIIIVGIIVGSIVTSLYLPLYTLGSSISGS